MAQILARLNSTDVRVVHSRDGMDEISISDLTDSYGFGQAASSIQHEVIDPEQLGFPKTSVDQLRGGSPAENREIFDHILDGAKGPKRDIVILNYASIRSNAAEYYPEPLPEWVDDLPGSFVVYGEDSRGQNIVVYLVTGS